jgi:aryl-alcohol dehydrogenase-like predicted oxidoreductase
MTTRELGRTGIQVFPVGLGGMPLSVEGRPEEPRALETLKAALDAGMTFIDTANVYCFDERDLGHNERLIAKALDLSGKKKSVVVATKGGLNRRGTYWPRDASPKFLRLSCEKSLKALGLEAIALYQLHAPDEKVPFEDSVGELSRLKEEGKILHVGLSNVSLQELDRAQKIVRIESVQNRCHPLNSQDYANGLLQACEKQGVSYLPYSVVGGHVGHARVADTPLLQELGKKYEHGPYAVMVAWHLDKSRSIIPIPGASKPSSAKNSALAAGLTLSAEDVLKIDGLGVRPSGIGPRRWRWFGALLPRWE